MIQILHKVKLASSSVYLLFFFLFLNFSLTETQAQKTVQFRISTVYSNVDDMDGWPNGDSDPQWDYNITDNTFGTSDGSNTELGGTNCPYSRTLTQHSIIKHLIVLCRHLIIFWRVWKMMRLVRMQIRVIELYRFSGLNPNRYLV